MTLLINQRKLPKGQLFFEYFHTATGRTPPQGFNLRASVEEDPLVRIYERISVRGEVRT